MQRIGHSRGHSQRSSPNAFRVGAGVITRLEPQHYAPVIKRIAPDLRFEIGFRAGCLHNRRR
jgi:hypothetical protein